MTAVVARPRRHAYLGDRDRRRIDEVVGRINGLESRFGALPDHELRGLTASFRTRREQGERLGALLPEAFAAVREASQRTLGLRHRDGQLAGGVVLHEGKIAELGAGEGKTLMATLAGYLNALAGKGVHVVTGNDYLAQRDRDRMAPLYQMLGLSVAALDASIAPGSPRRRVAYAADITYGTAVEFAFDYLRDNMASDLAGRIQRPLHFAIVDDIDYVLIDEAGGPISVSRSEATDADRYAIVSSAVARLTPGQGYRANVQAKAVTITEAGIDEIERALGVDNIYADIELTGRLYNALRAHAVYVRDADYLVEDGAVLVLDRATGRVTPGRRFGDGLQQALEAKEHVAIQPKSRTLATMTCQDYLGLYAKWAGMTGTAMTLSEEFWQVYRLHVVPIAPSVPQRRVDHPDLIHRRAAGKLRGVVAEVVARRAFGQPVLVVTASVEASEQLSLLLSEQDVPHAVLNAKQRAREAEIVARAGCSGAVTISTNMTGRGTDIRLGGDPEFLASDVIAERVVEPGTATADERDSARQEAERRCAEDRQRVLGRGGLYVIGTEHHDSRRMDDQLRGRAGRQGDPGESRFIVSYEDPTMVRLGANSNARLMDRLGMGEDFAIESRVLTGTIRRRQEWLEAHDADWRRWVKAFDDEVALQREAVYRDRRAILEREDVHDRALAMIRDEVRHRVARATASRAARDWDVDGLLRQLAQWQVVLTVAATADQVRALRRGTLSATAVAAAEHTYAAKEQAVIGAVTEHHATAPGAYFMRQFERMVMLQEIDVLWADHLAHLDELRSGVGLRRLAGRDPLVEFRRDAFLAFERLKGAVRFHVVDSLLRGAVLIQIPESPRSRGADA